MNPQPKSKRYESPQYLDFIRGLPCAVCGGQSEPHHTVSRGASGSDLTCIPLCRKDHSYCHSTSKDVFENKANININDVRIKIMEKYIELLESGLYPPCNGGHT